MQRTLILATVAALVSFTGLAQAADAQAMSWQQGLSRTDLIRQDLEAADREVDHRPTCSCRWKTASPA